MSDQPEATTSPMQRSSESDPLKALAVAVDALERDVEAVAQRLRDGIGADEQVQRMAEDRTRLARELDEATARANSLKDINRDVSNRLVSAMETVRSVIDQRAG